MDIHGGIVAIAAFAVIAAYLAVRAAVRTFRSARNLRYYSLRRQHTRSAWRLLVAAVLLLAFAYWLPTSGQRIAFTYFPPSPTPSLTPTLTVSPTITLSPTITFTSTITDTPSVTDTITPTSSPSVPLAIEAIFTSLVTPNPEAAFSPIEFSTEYDGVFAIDPQSVFQNPVGHMYGAFSYDGMIPGVQWTAIWLRDGKLVNFETKPWDGTTGGYGFTDWNPPAHEWLPGNYEVQLFVGLDWMIVGTFSVQGEAPTASPTVTRTATTRPTATRTPSLTPPMPTSTPRPTASLVP